MSGWKRIETAPRDRPLLLANYEAMDLIACVPHVWAARWMDGVGWAEFSHAATNENGVATHWAELPEPAPDGVAMGLRGLAAPLTEEELIAALTEKRPKRRRKVS